MDKRVILAVAGSGKTYHICKEIDENKRNIIIAYTKQNIKNILNELQKRFNRIPENTLVTTFHSFVYNHMIRPFDILIGDFYGKNNFVSKGVTIQTPPEPSIILNNGIRKSNPKYNKIDTLEHYIFNDKYYCEYLSKLILKTKNKKISLIDIGCDNVNKFFDNIYVDEMQDFREYNWELLVEIIKRVNNILLVGDYHQHSVSGLNNCGEPFECKKKYTTYYDYIKYLESIKLNVDKTTLLKSRRCSKEVCKFVKNKLGVDIESNENNSGRICWVNTKEEIMKILDNDKIVKLVWEKPEMYNFNAMTWSYSKGDTYDETCVILTDKYTKLDCENFTKPISIISINKLYVALTRSEGNVYIIKYNDFNEVYTKYLND